MKTLKRTFIIALSACLMLFAGILIAGSTTDKKAEAASADNNIPPEYYYDKIYYFSDSAPILNRTDFADYGFSDKVIYDIQTLISPQKLAFLVYSGYFWKFPCDPYAHCVVVIELKTIRPDDQTLSDLFACLRAQYCKIMFISPYVDEYSSSSEPEISMPCNPADYAEFLDYSIIDMVRQNLGYEDTYYDPDMFQSMWSEKNMRDLWEKTCILLDGRFIGATSFTGVDSTYDAKSILAESNFFQRMLLDMYYGPLDANYNPEATKRINFEKAMYADLWQFFYEKEYEQYMELDYYNLKIDNLINLWRESYFNYEEFISKYGEEYREFSQEIIWNYFMNGSKQGNDAVIAELFGAGTHILVNFPGTDYYWDILNNYNSDDSVIRIYQFTNTEDFLRYFADYRVYIMVIWEFDFYDFAYALQDFFIERYQILISIYVWPEDPIEWSPEGLIITTFDDLFGEYGLSESNTVDEDDAFKQLLLELLSQLLYSPFLARYGATA